MSKDWHSGCRMAMLISTKILLAGMALCTFEPFTNHFRHHKQALSVQEFLYLSNIAVVLTALTVSASILRCSHPAFQALHSFAAPAATVLSIVVVAIFWGLFFTKRAMVIRTNTGPGVWAVLRECPKHVFPLLALAIDYSSTTLQRSGTHRLFFGVFAAAYYLACEMLVRAGIYLYPFLEHLAWWLRPVVFLLIMLVSLLLYEVMY